MIEAYEAISFFKNTSKRGTNYERVEVEKVVEKVVTRSIAEQYALYIAFLLIAVQHFSGYFCIMEYFLIIHENDKIDVIDVNTGMILILATALVFAFYLARR